MAVLSCFPAFALAFLLTALSTLCGIITVTPLNCCDFRETPSAQLLGCTLDNLALQNTSQAISEAIDILAISYYTDSIVRYAAHSYATNGAILKELNIPLLLFSDDRHEDIQIMIDIDDPRWNKVSLLRWVVELSQRKNRNRHKIWILWIDADLIIINASVIGTLRSEISSAEKEGIHFISSKDSRPESGVLNTGMILIDNSDWSLAFLESWWSLYSRKSHSDQAVFTYIWNIDKLSTHPYIRLLPPHIMSSQFDAWNRQEDHHKILHLAGAHDIYRSGVFYFGHKVYCSRIAQSQLGLDRNRLQYIRFEIAKLIAQCAFSFIDRSIDGDHVCNQLKEFREMGPIDIKEVRQMLQNAIQMGFAAYNGNSNEGVLSAYLNCSIDDFVCKALVHQRKILSKSLKIIYDISFKDFHSKMKKLVNAVEFDPVIFSNTNSLIPVIQTAIESGFEFLQLDYESRSIPGYTEDDFDLKERKRMLTDDLEPLTELLIALVRPGSYGHALGQYYFYKVLEFQIADSSYKNLNLLKQIEERWRSLEQLGCVKDIFSVYETATSCSAAGKSNDRKKIRNTDYIIWEHADEGAAVYFDIAQLHCENSSLDWFNAAENSLRLSGMKWAYSDGIPYTFHFGSTSWKREDLDMLMSQSRCALKAPRVVLENIVLKLRYSANCAHAMLSTPFVMSNHYDSKDWQYVENFYTSTASRVYLSMMIDEQQEFQ